MRTNLIVILGPTASGKTALGVKLAAEFQGEIISADSRQVYRGMDIGTGKDLSEYQAEGKNIAYHLIDIIEPELEFNVFEFQTRCFQIFHNLNERGALPVLVGGTGLYLESVLTGYVLPPVTQNDRLREELEEKSQAQLQDILLGMTPELHNKTDLDDRNRIIRKIEIERARQNQQDKRQQKPDIHAGVFGIYRERAELRKRISARLKQRLRDGLIEEVSTLHSQGVSWKRLDSFGLEYRYVAQYLQKQMTKDEMLSRLEIAIGQFAKRQMTWFRRMEKKGVAIEWITGDDYNHLRHRVTEMLK